MNKKTITLTPKHSDKAIKSKRDNGETSRRRLPPKTFFMYVANFDLEHPSFEKYELRYMFNGVNCVIESKGFEEYEACVISFQNFFKEVAAELSQLTSVQHTMAWETNPKLSHNDPRPNITPASEWKSGELVKLYVSLASLGETITKDNLVAICSGSIFTGQRDFSEQN